MLQVCEHLERLRNYNALFAAVAGLHVASVNRLKHTWAAVGPTTHERAALDHVLDLTQPAHNYLNYRKQLQLDTDARLPCIPYFGLYLSDLLHIEDGNESFVSDETSGESLVNFEKFRMLASVLEAIASYQTLARRYSLLPVPLIQRHVTDDERVFDDKHLYALSLEHEPRGAAPPEPAAAEKRRKSGNKLFQRLRSRRPDPGTDVPGRMQPVRRSPSRTASPAPIARPSAAE